MLAPAPAIAGAWTEPAGQGLAIETLTGWIGQGAPYRGVAAPREDKVEAQTYFEYGLWDRITLFGEISAERYALTPPEADRYYGFDYSGAGLRARLWSDDAWTFAIEASGYLSGARDAAKPAQDGNAGPEADARLAAGCNFTLFGAPAFLNAEAGYRLRVEGPPGEVHADLTLGVSWTPRAQILAQAFNTVSAGAGGPGFPAWESHKGQLSVVYALDDKTSVQIGGFATLFRRNADAEYGGLVALWRRF